MIPIFIIPAKHSCVELLGPPTCGSHHSLPCLLLPFLPHILPRARTHRLIVIPHPGTPRDHPNDRSLIILGTTPTIGSVWPLHAHHHCPPNHLRNPDLAIQKRASPPVPSHLDLPKIAPRARIMRPKSRPDSVPYGPRRRRPSTDIPRRPHRRIVRARLHAIERQIHKGARGIVVGDLHHASEAADDLVLRGGEAGWTVAFEDADRGAVVGSAAAAEDGVTAGGLDGGDDGGGGCGAADVDELGGEVGGDGVDARERSYRGGDGFNAGIAVKGDGEGGLPWGVSDVVVGGGGKGVQQLRTV